MNVITKYSTSCAYVMTDGTVQFEASDHNQSLYNARVKAIAFINKHVGNKSINTVNVWITDSNGNQVYKTGFDNMNPFIETENTTNDGNSTANT